MKINLETIFQDHDLKKTPFRYELLGLFYDTRSSLTVEEIKSKVTFSKDKVTIYRALDAFERNGLIHRVPDKNNLIRYALCYSECHTDQHADSHAHFICNTCHETYCMKEIESPKINSTQEFNIKSSELILEGICPYCEKQPS